MLVCPKCKLRYPNTNTRCWLDGVDLVEMQDPRLGTTLGGRYVIEYVLGEGGMATVYGGRHLLVDRPCAIKVMNPRYADNEVMCERFRREARSAQKLAHPNIIEIYDQGELPERGVYLVMELLEGRSLANLLDAGRLPLERALPVGIQVARALARAHDLDVIHRDLKPDNVFITKTKSGEELVKLLDFGIARSMQDARLTASGEVFGTPEYLAPERIKSADAGSSQDLYAFGVILFELLTGQLPFTGDDITQVFLKHLKDPPPDPRELDGTIPEPLAKLTLALMAKNVSERPVDAHRVCNDLSSVAGAIGIRVPPDFGKEGELIRATPRTLPPVTIDAWAERTRLFDQMLKVAFGRLPPLELTRLLEQVREQVALTADLRHRAVAEQRSVQGIEQRGRETRQRLNNAVDALGEDLSAARDELRAGLAAQFALLTQADIVQERMRRARQDVKEWEERASAAEPLQELADAYRKAADAVDSWCRMFKKVQTADERVTRARASIKDLEYQIDQLRQALGRHEEQIDRDLEARQVHLLQLSGQENELEQKLLQLASAFCDPLRLRDDMQPFFRQLEGSATPHAS